MAIAPLALLAACDIPVATWRMDETSGSKMVDSAGDHNGTLSNVIVGRPGVSGRAYEFNGTSSIVRVPDGPGLDPGGADFTYSAWMKTTTLPPNATSDIIRKGLSTTSGGDYKMELYPVNGSARARCFIRGSTGQATAGGGNDLDDGDWHHIVCRRSGHALTLSIDGTTVKTTTVSVGSISNSAEVVVGAKSTSQDFYDGLLDDVQIVLG